MEESERPAKMRKIEESSTHVIGISEHESPSSHIHKDTTRDENMIEAEENINLNPDSQSLQNADDPPHVSSSTATTEPVPESEAPATLSKNQLKKLKRHQEWEAGRDHRKEVRKIKQKEKRDRHRAVRDSAAAPVLSTSLTTIPSLPAPQRKPRPHPVQLPITIILDCSFNDLMTPNEMISLASQLTRCYSDNSKAKFRTHLVLSSFGGALKERFDTVLHGHHKNWKGVRFRSESFVEVAEEAKGWMVEEKKAVKKGQVDSEDVKTNDATKAEKAGNLLDLENSRDPETMGSLEQEQEPDSKAQQASEAQLEIPDDAATSRPLIQSDNPNSSAQPSSTSTAALPSNPPLSAESTSPRTIYLTADSPHTLSTLSPYTTYILGALVDRNRHKGICYKRAMDAGVETAKLPIGEYLQMNSRKVLATSHVCEIMLRYLETKDWGEAMEVVMPKRKGGTRKGEGKGQGDGGGGDHGEEAENEGGDA